MGTEKSVISDTPKPSLQQIISTSEESENAREKIAELEQRVKELVQQIHNLQSSLIDWHSAMFGAISLILKPHKYNLTLEREHLLNLMPTRIDCLVVKKNADIPIDLDVFRLFRKHNVVEFKSYRDDLDENVIWHTIGYAASYKSLEPDVSADEVTITIFRTSFPRKLLKELEDHGWIIEEKYHNIIYLTGKIDIPIQIVVARELGDDYIPLEILTGRAKETDVRRFIEFRGTLTERNDRLYADAILWACAEANTTLFDKLKEEEKMYGALRELFRDDFIKERQEERMGTLNTVAELMIKDGMPGDKISRFTNLGRKDIDTIAHRLNRTVNWNEART